MYETVYDFFQYSERHREGVPIFKYAVEHLSKDSLSKARMLYCYGSLLCPNESFEKGKPYIDAGFELAKEHQSKRDMGVALWYRTARDPKPNYAKEKYDRLWLKAHDYCEEAGETFYQARALSNYLINVDQHEYQGLYSRILALYEDSQGYLGLTLIYHNYAWQQLEHAGDFEKALEFNNKSIHNESYFDRTWWRLWHLYCRWEVFIAMGTLAQAKELLTEWGIILIDNIDPDFSLTKWAPFEYALVCARMALIENNTDLAETHLHTAAALHEGQPMPEETAQYFNNQYASFYLSKKDYQRAKDHAWTTINLALDQDHQNNDFWRTQGYVLHCTACIALGELDNAQLSAQAALRIAQKRSLKPRILAIMVLFAEILLHNSDKEMASQLLASVTQNRASTFETRQAARILLETIIQPELLDPLDYEAALALIQSLPPQSP